MNRVLVINVVGLTPHLIGENTPAIQNWLNKTARLKPIAPVLPAVTCSVQSTYLTGLWPKDHGIVGNGWYFKDLAEILFWRQSNHLVRGEMIWDTARRTKPDLKVAQLFWWYNMYSTADISVTPRPMYPADGRKIPDIYTEPSSLRETLQEKFGRFPLFHFWGPLADIRSSRWIVNATIDVLGQHNPDLTFVYIPHLDYNLQRLGPHHPDIAKDLQQVDELVGRLLDYCSAHSITPIILSEYGIEEVHTAIPINQFLREKGWLKVRTELGRELLDAGASHAFAVCDHQIAHVYIHQKELINEVRSALEKLPGIDAVYDHQEQEKINIKNDRAGDLFVIAKPGHWFCYYYWLTHKSAPDFARTVDIHRKPGYDPVELFYDPEIKLLPLKLASLLIKKQLGFRTLFDVIPLRPDLVKGSHGRAPSGPQHGPVFISERSDLLTVGNLSPVEIKNLILGHLDL